MTSTAPSRPRDPAEPRPAGAGGRARRRFRPAEVHLIGDLPSPHRWMVVGALVALGLLPVISAVVVLIQGWTPTGDNALIGLRVHDVLTGHLPLIGQPTTGENFGSGIPTSHPGPIEFYLVAPFVALLGPTVGLAIGAATINAAALVGIGWLAFRRGGVALMGLTALCTLAMTRSLGGNLLHDPVSSNVGSVAALALLFACWSVLAGDLRTIPAFVVVGTFALQDHLSYLGTGGPVVIVTIGVGCWWIRQVRRRAASHDWLTRTLWWSAGVGLVLWAPVLIDEVVGDQNLNAIFRTFTGKRTPGEGLSFAFGRVAEALAPVPLFARRLDPLGYLHTPATHELVLGYAVLLGVIVLGVVWWRRRDSALSAMSFVTALAAVAGAYTAVKLPVGAGVQASNLRWMWTVGVFGWITLAWSTWRVLPSVAREVAGPPLGVLGAIGLLLASVGTLRTVDLATDRDGELAASTKELIARLEDELPEGTYRVSYAGGSVVVSVGPAVVHGLDHRGDTVLMDIGPFTRAYADHRAYEGQPVDGTLVITSEADASYPEGTKLIARQEFKVNRKEADVNTIRVYLVDGPT